MMFDVDNTKIAVISVNKNIGPRPPNLTYMKKLLTNVGIKMKPSEIEKKSGSNVPKIIQ